MAKKVKVANNGLKAQVKVLNKVALQVSGDVVDLALKNGEMGQKIFGKVLQGSVTIFGMQQDLVLTALEKAAQNERVQKFVKVPVGYFNRFKKTAEETTASVKDTIDQTTSIAKKEAAITANRISKKLEVVTKAKNKVVEAVTEATEEVAETVTKTGKEVADIAEDTVEKMEMEQPVIVPADNLKKINGIGPKVEQILTMAGYGTYQQIASAKAEDLEEVLTVAGNRYKKFDPRPWIAQAKLAAAGDFEGLEAWNEAN